MWGLRPVGTGPMLPLAAYLEDTDCSINSLWIHVERMHHRNDRSSYYAYDPISRTLPEGHTFIKKQKKTKNQNQSPGRDGHLNLHHHSRWTTPPALTYSVLTTALGVGTAGCLVLERKPGAKRWNSWSHVLPHCSALPPWSVSFTSGQSSKSPQSIRKAPQYHRKAPWR